MYETYIGLNQRPFAAVPVVEGYYPATICENARAALTRCLERGEGIGLLVGPVGTGKTLLCQKLGEQFKNAFHVVLLSSGRLSTRRSLFQVMLYELGQPYRSMDEGELRLALVDFLMLGKDQKRGLILFVDEAHTLPLRLLDEIRMLTNLNRAGHPLVRVVLAGSCSLEERLASPKLDSFNSRISTRCYLEAFNRTETSEYLRAKIEMAGGDGEEIFSDGACQSVYRATEGVARLVNQLCDHALLVAFSAGRRRLEAEHIEEAWADLQQLPTPWNGDAQTEKPSVIEFGRLDDASEDEFSEEDAPAISLKLNTDMDDLDGEEFEPSRQIDSIQQLIVGAEESYEPTAEAAPEIDLSFDEVEPHPFQEAFEQEEIVSDRYAAISTNVYLQTYHQIFQSDFLMPSSNAREQGRQVEKIDSKQDAVPEVTRYGSGTVEAAAAPAKEPEKAEAILPPPASEPVKPVEAVVEPIPLKKAEPKAKEIPSPRPTRRKDYTGLFAKLRRLG